MNEEEKGVIVSWADDFGIELSSSEIDLFDIYIEELLAWNKRVNLTGLTSRQGIIKELLLDSLIPAPFMPEEGRFLDVGSGAGFPGIPLKICKPRLKAHLIEASSKKVSFLKQVIRLADLSEIEVMRGRIENDWSILHPEGYHIITTRALAPLSQALAWCAPHLLCGGWLVNFQGSRFEDALKESSHIIKEHHLFLFKRIRYTLPGKNSPRHLLILMKRK